MWLAASCRCFIFTFFSAYFCGCLIHSYIAYDKSLHCIKCITNVDIRVANDFRRASYDIDVFNMAITGTSHIGRTVKEAQVAKSVNTCPFVAPFGSGLGIT